MTVTSSCAAFMCTLVVLSAVETSLWKPDIWGRFTDPSSEGSEDSNDCYEGVGLYYKVSETASGQACAEWGAETRRRFLSTDLHSGRHNYCRNLHLRWRPWCYVWRNHQLQWEYWDVLQCGSQPAEDSTCGRRSRRRQMKIVGGAVASVESHPWMAAVFWRSRSRKEIFRCGGSLISACWVFTAAHCFHEG